MPLRSNPFRVFALTSALFLPILAQADISAEAALDKIYGKQNKQQDCWQAVDGDNRYCMKIDHADKRASVTGNRLYLIVAGEAVDEEGKPDDSHAASGLIGAFVLEEHNGKADIIASNPKIPMGSFGAPPTDWRLRQLSPSDYWGWVNTTGGGNQGVFGSWHMILAPYGKNIRNLTGFPASYDNAGRCADKRCERTSSSIESKLEIDASQPGEKVYPLRITVTGKLKGKKLVPKTWTLPFDFKKWSYIAPTDWPLKYAVF